MGNTTLVEDAEAIKNNTAYHDASIRGIVGLEVDFAKRFSAVGNLISKQLLHLGNIRLE